MVGLATAWHLQEHDIRVTVYERDHVGAGSSWGNAGWLTPALTAPLPEPAVLRYGVRAVVSPSSPVYVPLRPDPRLLRFLTGFARHSTERHWGRGMRAYAPMNRRALDAFDELTDNGVAATTRPADPFLAAFRTPDERAALVDELEHIQDAGQAVKYDLLTGHEARAIEPALSSAVGAVIRLHDQRYINPPAFVGELARAVVDRGGRIVEGASVSGVRPDNGGAYLTTREDVDGTNRYDAVVLANGAWIGRLARQFGVRQPVQAGRGYSFSVARRAPSVHARVLPCPTSRMHAAPRPRRNAAARRRDDGVPRPRRSTRPTPYRRDRQRRAPVAERRRPRRPS